MEKSFGTKWLVNYLHRLGFSMCYDEVTQYRQSVAESSTTELSNGDVQDKASVQLVAGNIDQNQVIFTGKGTFHGMGVISASTFQMIKDVTVQRLIERRKASDFI